MDRRSLIAAGALGATALATAARASDAPAAGASLNIAGVGLPVIDGGRLRNYVFVSMRLHLGAGATPQTMRTKEAFIRDALVRSAHRTPFLVPNDWTRLDERALSASLIASCSAIAGRGSVSRVEIISQAPRRRTGVPGG